MSCEVDKFDKDKKNIFNDQNWHQNQKDIKERFPNDEYGLIQLRIEHIVAEHTVKGKLLTAKKQKSRQSDFHG